MTVVTLVTMPVTQGQVPVTSLSPVSLESGDAYEALDERSVRNRSKNNCWQVPKIGIVFGQPRETHG